MLDKKIPIKKIFFYKSIKLKKNYTFYVIDTKTSAKPF